MTLSKKLLLALSQLPDDYIRDGVSIAEFNGTFVAIHPELPPICYSLFSKGWDQIEFHDSPASHENP